MSAPADRYLLACYDHGGAWRGVADINLEVDATTAAPDDDHVRLGGSHGSRHPRSGKDFGSHRDSRVSVTPEVWIREAWAL